MRSRAHFQGHPIHPMLVAFRSRSSTGALAFDLAGRARGMPAGATGAYWASPRSATGAGRRGLPGDHRLPLRRPPNSSGKAGPPST